MNKTNWSNRAQELNKIWTDRNGVSDYRKKMIELIEFELGKDNNQMLLDCGCGTGLVYELLDEKFKPYYYGIDFTQDMIDHCQKKFPNNWDHFWVSDLTKFRSELRTFDIMITQNVLQHILLFQIALDNIFSSAGNCVIFCERTHNGQTLIAGYDPAVRWRFNVVDFFNILKFFANKHNWAGGVEILDHPKTTFDLENRLTIFRVYRNKVTKNKIDLNEYIYKPIRLEKYISLERKILRMIFRPFKAIRYFIKTANNS